MRKRMKRLRRKESKRFVRMKMKKRTSERVGIAKQDWKSKNNLNEWMRTVQDKSKNKIKITKI